MENKKTMRCAIYTRKSHEDGLEQEFNSLDAQREAGENYIASQKGNGWRALPDRYDDGGFSGGNMERPALKRLLNDVEAGKIDIILVYKLDRLSRSLLDFMKLAEMLEQHNVSFVSVTQDINTSTSAGRMMLNILMTFAQYEREVIAERIRDKIAGAKRRGKHCGGCPVLGYDVNSEMKKLVVNKREAELVRKIYTRYCQVGSARQVAQEMNEQGHRNKTWKTSKGKLHEGTLFKPDIIYRILKNPLYVGRVPHYDKVYPGEQPAIVDEKTWNEAQKLLSENLVAGTGKKARAVSPFRGLLECGYCHGSFGLTYTQNHGRSYSYYLCEKDAKRAVGECPVRRIPSHDLEMLIMKALGEVFKTPTLLSKVYFAVKWINHEAIARLQAEQAELLASQEQLRGKLMTAAKLGAEESVALIRQLRTEINEVNQSLAVVNQELKKLNITHEDVMAAFSSIEQLWEELFPAERYHLLRLLIEKVIITSDGLRIQFKGGGIEQVAGELINFEQKKGA